MNAGESPQNQGRSVKAAPVRFQKAVSRSKENASGAPRGAPVRVMGRQSRFADGRGYAARQANGSAFRPANFGAPLPSDGGAKGSKPTIWTETRRDVPRGNAPARLNKMDGEGMTMSKFALVTLHRHSGARRRREPGIQNIGMSYLSGFRVRRFAAPR